jgi:hypothetical protein
LGERLCRDWKRILLLSNSSKLSKKQLERIAHRTIQYADGTNNRVLREMCCVMLYRMQNIFVWNCKSLASLNPDIVLIYGKMSNLVFG